MKQIRIVKDIDSCTECLHRKMYGVYSNYGDHRCTKAHDPNNDNTYTRSILAPMDHCGLITIPDWCPLEDV